MIGPILVAWRPLTQTRTPSGGILRPSSIKQRSPHRNIRAPQKKYPRFPNGEVSEAHHRLPPPPTQKNTLPGLKPFHPAPCTACPNGGPTEPTNEEELILSSWENKLVLKRPLPIPVAQAQ